MNEGCNTCEGCGNLLCFGRGYTPDPISGIYRTRGEKYLVVHKALPNDLKLRSTVTPIVRFSSRLIEVYMHPRGDQSMQAMSRNIAEETSSTS
jgi:hypothetical protein